MVDDVISSNKIYGPRIHYLKGETARRQPTQVVTDYISITTEVLKYHGDMTVAIDVIYTNKLASVVIILWGIKSKTEDYVNNISKLTIMTPIKKFVNL